MSLISCIFINVFSINEITVVVVISFEIVIHARCEISSPRIFLLGFEDERK